MEKIPKILSSSRTDEVSDLVREGTELILQYAANDEHLSNTANQLQSTNERCIVAVKSQKMLSELDDYDTRRDYTYRCLDGLVEGYTYHPDENIQSAAEAVKAILDRYGYDLIKASYSAQSTQTQSLFRDMAEPQIASSLELLSGCPVLLEQLKQDEAAFEEVDRAWTKTKTDAGDRKSASEIRRELITLFNSKVVVYLRAMMLTGNDSYKQLSAQLSRIITDNNNMVKRRRNRKK